MRRCFQYIVHIQFGNSVQKFNGKGFESIVSISPWYAMHSSEEYRIQNNPLATWQLSRVPYFAKDLEGETLICNAADGIFMSDVTINLISHDACAALNYAARLRLRTA